MGECTSPNCRKWTLVSAISKKRRSSSPSNFAGAGVSSRLPGRGAAAGRYAAGRISIFARSVRAQRGDCSRSPPQGKTFELIDRAAAYSEDDDLVA